MSEGQYDNYQERKLNQRGRLHALQCISTECNLNHVDIHALTLSLLHCCIPQSSPKLRLRCPQRGELAQALGRGDEQHLLLIPPLQQVHVREPNLCRSQRDKPQGVRKGCLILSVKHCKHIAYSYVLIPSSPLITTTFPSRDLLPPSTPATPPPPAAPASQRSRAALGPWWPPLWPDRA